MIHMLGRSRWRQLSAARFDFETHDRELRHDPLWENPDKLEEVEDAMLSAFLKFARESAVRHYRLDERWDSWRENWRGGKDQDPAGEGFRTQCCAGRVSSSTSRRGCRPVIIPRSELAFG